MSFILQNNVLRRTLVLALFLVSMLGPWMFDVIHVPAEFACSEPFVRLSGDFCGYPLSGLETMQWFGGGIPYTFAELIKGKLISEIPQLLIILLFITIIFLPFFSLLLLIVNQHSRQLRTINIVAWGLACLLALTLFLLQIQSDQLDSLFYFLWGLALYLLLGIGTIIDEILMWRWKGKLISASL